MEYSAIISFIGEHWLAIASMAAAPLSSLGMWKIAHKKLLMDQAKQLKDEKLAVHEENALQTDAWTRRFSAIMDAAENRNDDLMDEVKALRAEVAALRKVIDHQRNFCLGCPRLPQLTTFLNQIEIDSAKEQANAAG